MRLHELHGVKRHSRTTLPDLIHQLFPGARSYSGRYGTVIDNPAWPFVVKLWFNDDCYLDFVDYAIENPNPHYPRFIKKVMKMPAFFRRERGSGDVFWMVRIERLQELDEAVAGKLCRAFIDADRLIRHPAEINAQFGAEQRGLFAAVAALYTAPIKCAPDWHPGNLMQRPDGTVVITDPFWYGETIYQMVRKAREAELDLGDDEPDYVDGGEKSYPKKQKIPAPQIQSDDDIPF
jgi:hypothetical protein